MITTNATELSAMRHAVQNAELIVVSDWSQYTSFEYMDAMVQTGYDILYASHIPCLRITSQFFNVQTRLINHAAARIVSLSKARGQSIARHRKN